MEIKAVEIYRCGHFYFGIISIDGKEEKRGPFRSAERARIGMQVRIDWLKNIEKRRIERSTQET